jgi:hypothetical protein
MLFAAGWSTMECLIFWLVIVIPILIVYGLIHLYVMTNHPDVYKSWEDGRRQREQAELEERQANAAHRRARNQQGMSILGRLLKGFFR